MNTVILIGRLVKDPQLATTQNGKEYCNFTLAVNRQFKDKSGERQADFIQCVVWGQTAKNLCQYQSKGNQIMFVRKVEEPETPYYTAEFDKDNKKVVQIHGDHNISATLEVNDFIAKWLKKIPQLKAKKEMVYRAYQQETALA